MEEDLISIVGGNISGLATAIKLSEKNYPLNCEIFEAHSGAWDKPCGGGFGLGWGNMLKNKYNLKIPLELSKTLILGSRFNTIELPIPLYVSSREKLQHELLKYIESIDTIKIHYNTKISFKKDWKKFHKINIVATGINGFTRQALDKNFRDLGLYKYTVLDNPNESFRSTIFYMIPEIKGYAWYFPAPNGKVDIGIGSLLKSSSIEVHFSKFLFWLKKKFDIKFNQKLNLKSWGIPIPVNKPGKIVRKLNKKLFIGVGDAIELADPTTAAGIEPAWFSGEILASSIESYSQININQYYNNLVRFLVDNNYASTSQGILASITRNPKIFHLIFSFLPNFLLKQIIREPNFK